MYKKYRFDKRTKSEFKKDIKISHKIEADIAIRMCQRIFDETGEWPELLPNGCDVSGEFIEKMSNVSHAPDFLINGEPIEITHSRSECKKPYFHQKESKIKKCLKNKWTVVFVHGIRAFEEPKYLSMDYKLLNKVSQKAEEKYNLVPHPTRNGVVHKKSYRYDFDFFSESDWKTLPPMSEKARSQYNHILKLVK